MFKDEHSATLSQSQASYLLYVQLVLLLLSAFVFKSTGYLDSGRGFAWGSIINILPNWVFARIYFAKAGAQQAEQIVTAFYGGVTFKWMLTMASFIIVFSLLRPPALPFFSGFMLMQLIWVVASVLRGEQ